VELYLPADCSFSFVALIFDEATDLSPPSQGVGGSKFASDFGKNAYLQPINNNVS
jgi:hypothetical protein